MAIYRTIHVNFWEDSKVLDDMNIEERYFWLYLLTNPHTNQVGCFEISKRQMKSETDFDSQKINILLEKFENELQLISYSSKTKEIFIKNWYKYHWGNSPKVLTCIEKEFIKIKDEKIKEKVYEMLKETYSIDTLSIEYKNGIYRVGIKEKEKEKENKKSESKLSQESNFVAPTLADIISFGSENDVSIEYCNKFFNHYESVNWKIKGVKLINWQAKFLEWIQDDIDGGKIKNKKEYDTKMIYTERKTGRDFQYDKEGNKHYVSD